MLTESLTALAAAGGAAVAQAAGTDAWEGLRQRVAQWFGRGDERRERTELERLDSSAAELATARDTQLEQVRIRQEADWRARFETLLKSLEGNERAQAAANLHALLGRPETGAGAVFGNTFQAPTAVQTGICPKQYNQFGAGG